MDISEKRLEEGGGPQRRASVASSASSSSASCASAVNVSRISLSRQRTVPAGEYDTTDRTNLDRQRTAASIYEHTVGEPAHPVRPSRSASIFSLVVSRQHHPEEWPEFGGGKAYPPPLPEQESYVVDFTGPNDPLHGQNWPLKKKLIVSAVLGYSTFVAAWGSSIFSSATLTVSKHFGVSTEVSLLGISLYVLGFATGPLVWAPLSELRGRRTPLLLGMFGFSIFQFAVAVGKDIQTVLISRFFGGVFASSPITVVGAVMADIFGEQTRAIAVATFSMMVFSGPLVGPIAGSFTVLNPNLGWRWTEYITGLMGFLAFLLDVIFLKETYPPVLLIEKAAHLRRITKNWGIHAKQEEITIDFASLLSKNFSRPLRLIFTEPIVFLISLYTAFVYAILYLFLISYPIVFSQIHHWTPGIASLPYIGIVLGEILGGLLVISFQPWTNRRAAKNGPRPEDRLVPAIIGSFFFPIGLFWFAWTGADSSIHWIVPVIAGVPLGLGIITIFLQCLNYLIDSYLHFAASAIAANSFMRSAFAAGFPLFARFLFEPKPSGKLGVGWAGSLLGFFAIAMIPIPIFFFLYGEKIRGRSKWAPTK